jgi:hypothetical protein
VNRLALAGALAWSALGCRDIDRFDTEDGTAYCGAMVNFSQKNSFIPSVGGRPDLRLKLQLDTDSLTVQPGVITSNDALNGLCKPLPSFDAAPLRAIPEVLNDPLSLIEFGDGREYNFFAWADSTCQGTMLAVVSLMKNDSVEVRLLKPKPNPPPGAPDEERPGFILFQLTRRESGSRCLE